MKRILFYIIFGILTSNLVQATHLIGGSMSYQYLGQNTKGNFRYKITLRMYRDCKQNVGGTVQFDPKIEIGVYHSNSSKSKHKTEQFTLVSKRLVPAPGRTDCPENQNYCIEEGFYEKVIELEPSTLGYELSYEVCCRNVQNNIVTGSNQPTQGQTYYCKIPRTNIKNSSPVFVNGVPSPYMCVNDTTSFLNTALDADGDSLVYYFVKPFGGSVATAVWEPPANLSIKPIQYNPGFDENSPFGSGGYSSIDRVNGLTNYLAKNTGNYIVAVEVAEYRDGELLSTVRLDLQIIFINCGVNRKPSISSNKGKTFEIDAGSKLCFDITADDLDNDNIKLSGDGDMFTGLNGWKGPKATLSTKTGKGKVTSEFCWQTSCDQGRDNPYLFSATAQDDGCPGKYHSVNFSIKVKPFISKLDLGGSVSLCQNAIGIYMAYFTAPFSKFEWEVTGGEIQSGQGTDKLTVKWTGSGNGKVRCREISQFGCPGPWKELTVKIILSPPKPIIAGMDTVCLNSTGQIYSISNFDGFTTSTWKIITGTLESYSNNVVSIGWPKLGDQVISVFSVNSNGCFSDTAYFKVNVRKPKPIIFGSSSICPNSSNVPYSAIGMGKSNFLWSISGGTFKGSNALPSIFVNWGNEGTGSLTVIETDRFGCVSDPINFSVNKTYLMDAELAKGKMSVCEFDKAVPYFVYPVPGTTYVWTVTGGTLLPPGNTSTIKIDWGAAGLGTIDVERRAFDSINKRACVSLPAKFDVIINPTPNANFIAGDFDICQLPDTVVYKINGFVGSTYKWLLNGNPNGIKGQGTNSIKLAFNIPGSYTLSVLETSKDSCIGTVVDTIIMVRPKPTANSILGPKISCTPDLLNRQYSVQGFPNSTYQWVINNGTIIKGNGNDSIIVNWSQLEPAWLKVYETSEFGCIGDTITQDITIDFLNLEMLVVSVGDPDDNMDINWITPNSKTVNRNFEIQKRNSGDFTWVDLTNVNFNNFIEQPLNTDINAFDYLVKAKDLCGVEKVTDVHTNVWLSGSKTEDPYAIEMDFTPYFGFKNGVTKYILYRKMVDQNNTFQPYDSFMLPQKLFYKNGLEGYKQCYRVKSIENGGNNQVSYSNEICFNFSPTIYIPNAFTPNNDGINDYFFIQAGAIKNYELKIFNRWGEELWRTNDFKSQGWDGVYKEKQAQMDVYMYAITLTDFKDKVYTMNGTVHLIR